MELHFTKTNGPVDDAIDELLKLAGDIHQKGIVREMILAALKAGQEDENKADLKLMNATLKEMRFTSKVFGPYKGVRKVTVLVLPERNPTIRFTSWHVFLAGNSSRPATWSSREGGPDSCRRSMKAPVRNTPSV